MRWHLPSTDVSILVEFVSEGEPVIPDTNSVILTVRDMAGAPLAGLGALAVAGPYLTQRTLVIPAANHALGSGEMTKTRFVEVNYTVSGVPLKVSDWYGIRAFIPLTVGPEDVRGLLGLRDKELPDADIDLFNAYLKLVRSNSTFPQLLLRTDGFERQANKAVALQAALDVLPSAPIRALKEETLSNASSIRASIDWSTLEASLMAQLDAVIGELFPDSIVAFGAGLFVVVTPTDVITNA